MSDVRFSRRFFAVFSPKPSGGWRGRGFYARDDQSMLMFLVHVNRAKVTSTFADRQRELPGTWIRPRSSTHYSARNESIGSDNQYRRNGKTLHNQNKKYNCTSSLFSLFSRQVFIFTSNSRARVTFFESQLVCPTFKSPLVNFFVLSKSRRNCSSPDSSFRSCKYTFYH